MNSLKCAQRRKYNHGNNPLDLREKRINDTHLTTDELNARAAELSKPQAPMAQIKVIARNRLGFSPLDQQSTAGKDGDIYGTGFTDLKYIHTIIRCQTVGCQSEGHFLLVGEAGLLDEDFEIGLDKPTPEPAKPRAEKLKWQVILDRAVM